MTEKIIDYRGDCWKVYQDVGLCLRIIPPGIDFEFILEADKLERIRKIVTCNGGEVISEKAIEGGVRVKVVKIEKIDG